MEPSFDTKEALFDKTESFTDSIDSFPDTIDPVFVTIWVLSFFFNNKLNIIFTNLEKGTSTIIVPKKPKNKLKQAIEK